MPRVTFSFSDAQLSGTLEETTPLSGGALALNPFRNVPKEDRFSHMGGGCGVVPFRSSIVRLALMKLVGSGVLAFLCAQNAKSQSVAFSCALAAAVNAVAVAHYLVIWAIRAQVLPESYKRFAAAVGRKTAEEDKDDDKKRLFVQELAVDSLRHSDWTVTLVLMVLDLWDLADHAMPLTLVNGTDVGEPQLLPGLTRDWCAALQPVIILLGTVPRFYLNEFKWSKHTEHEKYPGVPPNGWTSYYIWSSVGVVCWLGAAVVWLLCSIALTSRLWKDGAAPDNNMRGTDQWVVTLIVWLQAGYPATSLMEVIWSMCLGRRTGDTYSANLSFAKDFGFGTLDVLTKGGLALYCASRAMNGVD